MLNASSHRVVMITGDNALTACHIAREVSITSRACLIGDVWEDAFEWRTADETVRFTESKLDKLCKYDLCLTGAGLEAIDKQEGLYAKLLPLVWVYARVSPGQKVCESKTVFRLPYALISQKWMDFLMRRKRF
jgi:cation-transporting ATPase 13A1